VLTTGKVGLRLGDPSGVWVIEDGVLYLQTVIGNFGYYTTSFSSDGLERIL